MLHAAVMLPDNGRFHIADAVGDRETMTFDSLESVASGLGRLIAVFNDEEAYVMA